MNTKDQTEDLIAYEKRLTECVSYMESKSTKWRVIMVVAVLFLLLSVWNVWRDDTKYVRNTIKLLVIKLCNRCPKSKEFGMNCQCQRIDIKFKSKVSYSELVWAHKDLSASLTLLLLLCVAGGFQRSRGAKIITQRCRNVLQNYNMSCDEQGKLILKRPSR